MLTDSFPPMHDATRAHLISLSTATSALQNTLDRLYTSSQDGLSFNRLCYHILGYSGPTFIVIQDTEGGAVLLGGGRIGRWV